MPRDSQGLYSLPAGNPVVPGTLIESQWANPTMSDIGQALTDSLPRDGSAPMTEEKGVMIGMSVSDEEMTVRELMEKGGPGYTENAFVSSYLRNAVINTGADIDLATSSWNLLLKRLGFTKWPKRVKFNGATEIIWTKQTALGGIEAVISALNETLTGNRDGDTVDDLFG